jgi:tRNA threonylcarbamoyladenosine biosynthesis protein TsaB
VVPPGTRPHSPAAQALAHAPVPHASVIPAPRSWTRMVIACGSGPGSFTGLRIGLATAKGLCFALDKPLVMISSLAGLAARAPAGRVCATLDAFMGEVYAGLYTIVDGLPVADGEELVLPPAELRARLAAAPVGHVVGTGAVKYPELQVAPLLDHEPGPRAADLARLGAVRVARRDFDNLSTATPKYIRPSEAELVKKKREQ